MIEHGLDVKSDAMVSQRLREASEKGKKGTFLQTGIQYFPALCQDK